MPIEDRDDQLRSILESRTLENGDYWSFKGRAQRTKGHSYGQYPGMMVPQMQGELIADIRRVAPGTSHLLDPFVGSGTTLVEALTQGLDFTGQDVNPLAILLCRSKTGPFNHDYLCDQANIIMASAAADSTCAIECSFSGLHKWFRDDVAQELSRLRRAIRDISDLNARRFFWTALGETVRLTSNSRTSTFKLHIRPEEELSSRPSPLQIFSRTVRANLKSIAEQRETLAASGYLLEDHYRGTTEVHFGDSTKNIPEGAYDLLVTSPPYGDNKTTVPYGQYSYLPLQWIDLHDIDDAIDASWLSTTLTIDSKSIGGRLQNALREIDHVRHVSPSLETILSALTEKPVDRSQRVAAFCRDLYSALPVIVRALKPYSYMVWVVGNRRVGGLSIPVDRILVECLGSLGCVKVAGLNRSIPTKRMAVKNSVTTTMRSETILVMRKGDG